MSNREEIKDTALNVAMDIKSGHFDFPSESILTLIDEIYDDFESRTCENCNIKGCKIYYTLVGEIDDINRFSCNKWEAKKDEVQNEV